MNKKFKYTSLVAAGAVTLGLVGGTLAWFTSYDVETNKFQTGQTTDNDDDPNKKGIEINEFFEQPTAMVPGDTVNKDVQVTNTATYDQFVRVNFKVAVTEKNEEGKTVVNDYKVLSKQDGDRTVYYVDKYNDIELNFTNLTSTLNEGEGENTTIVTGKWYPIIDNDNVTHKDNTIYFYYLGKVKADDPKLLSGNDKKGDKYTQDQNYTYKLLDSVKLVPQHDITLDEDNNVVATQNDMYKNLKFDVIVTAESVQAKNGVYVDWCSDSLDFVYKDLEDGAWTPVTEEYIKHYNGPVRPTIRPTK